MARKKINTEIKQILEKIPEDKKAIAGRLADELIFIQETLTDLKSQIKEHGTVEHFEQGKQNFLRESPALKSYNNTVKQYSNLYKQLTDLLPKESPPTNSDNELYDFIKGGK